MNVKGDINMNISPINYAQTNSKFSKIEAGKKCVISDNQPVPETPKDEVSFKAGTSIAEFDKVIREVVSKKISSWNDCEKIFYTMRKPIYLSDTYTRNEIIGVGAVPRDAFFQLTDGNSFVAVMRKLIGKTAAKDDYERGLIREIQSKSADGELIFEKANIDLGLDVQPLIRLRRNGLIKGVSKSKNRLIPENQYELVFSTSKGGSEVIMGITKDGEISVQQLSNMDIPKYTLFHDNGKLKIYTSGNYEDGNFVGKYFNRNGSYNPFLSLILH